MYSIETRDLCHELLQADVVSGWDQVSMHDGIGMGKVLKTVKDVKCSLSLLDHISADIDAAVN